MKNKPPPNNILIHNGVSMLFFYEGNSKLSGIYEIRNRASNKSYIGQAKEFKERWKAHKSSLLRNKHQNKHLQYSFDVYFEILDHTNFLEFHILEIMENSTKEERNIREEYWIKEYFKEKIELYNKILEPTKETKKNKIKKNKLSQEHKTKISNSLKIKNLKGPFFGKFLSKEHKEKISLKMNGVLNPFYSKTHTKKTIEIIKKANIGRVSPRRKKIMIIHIVSGEVKYFNSGIEAAIFLNTKQCYISRVASGKRKHHKNWKINFVN